MLSIYLLVFLKLQLLSKWSSMNPFKSKDRVTAISSQSSSSSTSREMGFFIQSVIICGMLEVQGLAYDNLHYLEIAGEFKILPKLVQIWISILSCTCHSVVILCFNKRIRNQAKSVLMVHSKDRTITAQQPTTQITRL
uniref:Uncharacterized protein n=1 Tax=Ditylenchus dipsaci TaxID=166011 RepID=A0A915D4A7_9BILA